MSTRERLLEAVPDAIPHVDLRGLLLEGAECLGEPSGFVAVGRGAHLLAAFGRPNPDDVAAALRKARPPAAFLTSGEAVGVVGAVSGLPGERAILHRVGEGGLVRRSGLPRATLVERGARIDGFEGEVRRELEEFLGERPVGAVIEDDQVVAVCYPTLMTETYWDVSIETLEGFRRGGRATAAFFAAEEAMRATGLEPIWGALVSNPPSVALADALGFVPAGEIIVFSIR